MIDIRINLRVGESARGGIYAVYRFSPWQTVWSAAVWIAETFLGMEDFWSGELYNGPDMWVPIASS